MECDGVGFECVVLCVFVGRYWSIWFGWCDWCGGCCVSWVFGGLWLGVDGDGCCFGFVVVCVVVVWFWIVVFGVVDCWCDFVGFGWVSGVCV